MRRHVVVVTNNSSLSRHALAERFGRFGLPLEDHEVFSAMVAAAQLVAHEMPAARVLVFGYPGFRAQVKRTGVTVTGHVEVDYVVVGGHTGITYKGLTTALRALLRAARFIAVNVDRTCVGSGGGLLPGAGMFGAGRGSTTRRHCRQAVGHPLLEAAGSIGRPPANCLYVGDNLEADVVGAHAAGMDALLVLTGVTSAADEAADPPEHILPSVANLSALLPTSRVRKNKFVVGLDSVTRC